MKEPMTRPGVGTGIYIRKDGKILLGKRIGSFGSGTWCAPGGKLEMNEEWEANARRETREECGLEIQNVRLMHVTNDIMPESGTHYITLQFVADWLSGEPENREPDKCEGWDWFAWESLPQPLFKSTQNLVDAGYNPFHI